VLSATLQGAADINEAKIATSGLLAWLFLLATLRNVHSPASYGYGRHLVASFYVLTAMMALNLLVAWQHGIGFGDWARDVFPLANLSSVAMVPTFLRDDRERGVLRNALLSVMAFVALSGLLATSGNLVPGLPQVPNPLSIGGPWVPALLVAGAIAAIVEVPWRRRWPYLGAGLAGVAITVFAPTRTMWVGVAATAAVALLLNIRSGRLNVRRNATLIVFVGLSIAVTIQLWRSVGNRDTWSMQQARFATLNDLGGDQSVDIRHRQVSEALAQFAAAPWLGQGLGYAYHYHIEYTDRYDKGETYCHSDFANALCKMGILGTGALYAMLLLAVVVSGQLRRLGRHAGDRWFGYTCQIVWLVVLLTGNSCPVLQERGSTFLLGLMGGLTVALRPSVDEDRLHRRDSTADLPSRFPARPTRTCGTSDA